MSSSDFSVDTIQDWLVGRVARLLDVDPSQIGIDDPLSDFGLESIEAFTLSGELSDWLRMKLAPTLAWDFPSIAALAQHLAQEKCSMSENPENPA